MSYNHYQEVLNGGTTMQKSSKTEAGEGKTGKPKGGFSMKKKVFGLLVVITHLTQKPQKG